MTTFGWMHGFAGARTILPGITLGLMLAAGEQAQEPLRPLYFRLLLNRMEPARLTIPEGRYVLRLDNGIVLGEVRFRLDVAQGPRVLEGRIPRGAGRGKAMVLLKPGKYVLEAGGRSQWRSEISVTERRSH